LAQSALRLALIDPRYFSESIFTTETQSSLKKISKFEFFQLGALSASAVHDLCFL
jgi:hypothetical protein